MRIPGTCGECPYHSTSEYQCHNERGFVSHCLQGYMDNEDMRDFSYRYKRYAGCRLGLNLHKYEIKSSMCLELPCWHVLEDTQLIAIFYRKGDAEIFVARKEIS